MPRRGEWSEIEEEAKDAFVGEGRFPLRAYSEFMPPPYVGIKPYAPEMASKSATLGVTDGSALDITEYELAHELGPGLPKIAGRIISELAKLMSGAPHDLSRKLLAENAAWPPALAAAALGQRVADEGIVVVLPLALSRTQDDKGNVRWTLFGASHHGPSAPFWRSFGAGDEQRFARFAAWATGIPGPELRGLRVIAPEAELPPFAKRFALSTGEPLAGTRAVFTLEPFVRLPATVQRAYVEGSVRVFPTPASLIFFEHPLYRKLNEELPRATQIALLHLFARVEGRYGIRIPQSGWLDEHDPSQGQPASGHRVVQRVVRTHRWQRAPRDQTEIGDGAFTDKVTVALFSTNPDDLGLYGKPMGRNVQIWTEDYELLLDGPLATKADLNRAAKALDRGGRFGYRFLYPPMRAGGRELFWHLPLTARLDPATDAVSVYTDAPPLGYVSAEATSDPHRKHTALVPHLCSRQGHSEAAALFDRDPGRLRYTTSNNVRKLLEQREYLGRPLDPSFARALVHVPKDMTLDTWLSKLPEVASDKAGGERLAALLREGLGPAADPGQALTLDKTATRAFEQQLWRQIASLAEGALRAKESADNVVVNQGKTGGPAAKAAMVKPAVRRDLDRLADRIHDLYRGMIAHHGMRERAAVVDQAFRWETDFDFSWSSSWAKNQSGEACERNVVLMIPGKNRNEAVIMGDHYDTAYMEDVYEAEQGGDGLRAAAAGADDNHSATATLLLAADVLLPLARQGKLERDVWLVHLTGEEFPADCLGARALARALVERRLAFTAENGELADVSKTRVVGAFILDMIGHNAGRDRDVFQIAPGEGAGSARLALAAHRANERWNRFIVDRNRAPDRQSKGRAQRMPDGSQTPPPFAHLAVAGDVRTEWEPRSALYNTDGQIFSDVGIPVVLFMENYDISRSGYHDTHDTMKNIDLDYASAIAAIAIETVANVACAVTS